MAVAALPYIMAAFAAIGAISSANAQAASARSAATAADYNAKVDEQNAVAAQQQAGANEEAQRRRSAIALGEMRAGLADSGVALDGSAADIYRQSAANAELDALNIRYGGQLRAGGLAAQSQLDNYSGRAARSNANAALTGGYLSAGASALSAYSGAKLQQAQADYYRARPTGTGAYGG